ncbi:hypothetical protein ABIC09_007309 [Bradyrhizobium sp. S3.12.5]
MTRMLFGIAAGKICKAHPRLDRNARSSNAIDVARCVKQRIATPNSAI